jgi:hypothetical protein
MIQECTEVGDHGMQCAKHLHALPFHIPMRIAEHSERLRRRLLRFARANFGEQIAELCTKSAVFAHIYLLTSLHFIDVIIGCPHVLHVINQLFVHVGRCFQLLQLLHHGVIAKNSARQAQRVGRVL